MPPIIALIVCLIFIAFLLRVERQQNPYISFAIWIPTIWMLISASRPLGRWPWFSPPGTNIEEGSPIDRLVLGTLIFISIFFIFKRKVNYLSILKNNTALIILLMFAGLSILWSDFPFLSFKRWIKLLGTIPIAMVVLSEKTPLEAMESIFRKCAYILIPLSVILIKYYPHLGRAYGRWSGLEMWTGVTITKNSLGWLCAFSAFFFVWSYLKNKKNETFFRNDLIKICDLLVFLIAIYLLKGSGAAYSATSISIFIVGLISLFILNKKPLSAQNISKFLFFGTILIWVILTFSESFSATLTSLLNRDETFTGRREMWVMLIKEGARHPILGTGYGGYFGTPGNEFTEAFGGYWSHNGLLSVYVELGIVGIILVLMFHLEFYKRFKSIIITNFDWGIFGICFLTMSMLCNYTENIFLNSQTYYWNIMIFLMILFSAKNSYRGSNQ
jgi:O-antigen ligase